MALLARIEEVGSEEERGSERIRLRLSSASDAGTGAVTVHELSAGGFLIEAETSLDVGASISFDLPGAGVVEGEVIWASGRYFGGQFHTRLPQAALNAALGESRVIWPNFTPRSAADRSLSIAQPIAAPSPSFVAGEADAPALPLSTRVQVIAGASLLLWGLIGTSTWLLTRSVL
jgi:hypothetical protein